VVSPTGLVGFSIIEFLDRIERFNLSGPHWNGRTYQEEPNCDSPYHVITLFSELCAVKGSPP
jgi:hypothetical protein